MPEVLAFRDANGKVQLAKWIRELGKRDRTAYAKCIARVLDLKEEGSRLGPPRAKPLRDGVHELRVRHGHINYRMLYVFHDSSAVITKGLTKESEVPADDIDGAIDCKKLVALDKAKYTADLPDDFNE
jgi:putative component of toxin-antitoxin plasmid stabilization module